MSKTLVTRRCPSVFFLLWSTYSSNSVPLGAFYALASPVQYSGKRLQHDKQNVVEKGLLQTKNMDLICLWGS